MVDVLDSHTPAGFKRFLWIVLATGLAMFVLPAGPTQAGTIHPALADRLDALAPNESVSAILVLRDQAPIEAISTSLSARGATRQERHREVLLALQRTAAGAQGPILTRLAQLEAEEQIEGYAAYWIANLVVVHGIRAAIVELAARADVAQAELDFEINLISPVESHEDTPGVTEESGLRGSGGATSGVRCIQADRVWYELGVTGENTIVANLDTGVDGSHPALAGRWRGLHAPWQQAWHDVLGTDTNFPTDTGGHGTHVMGTMTGLGAATGDSIGVAPGAEWIAANAVNQNPGPEFDEDIIDCYQWFADPDGDVNTVDDVPDVVQNSWGVTFVPGFDYDLCDSRWWMVMDNLEAAGTVLIYSAGNSGPEAMTILSPADRTATPLNALSVGAIDGRGSFPYSIWPRSSRGPSGCPDPQIKPELVAPGVGVYSSIPGGGYWDRWSGTSLAGPHVAGVVALMRSANPDLEVDAIKQILLDTAVDLGATGEDNDYGWGVPNAYAAVLSVLTTTSIPETETEPRLRVEPSLPNPFTGSTSIRFTLLEASPVRVSIVDVQGRFVRTLLDRPCPAGPCTLEWDGRDSQAHVVPAGVYLYRVEVRDFMTEGKLLRID